MNPLLYICSKNLWTLKEFLPFVGVGGANGYYDHNMPHFPVCLSKAFLSLLQFFFVKCNHGWLQMAHSCKIKWTFLNEKRRRNSSAWRRWKFPHSTFCFATIRPAVQSNTLAIKWNRLFCLLKYFKDITRVHKEKWIKRSKINF